MGSVPFSFLDDLLGLQRDDAAAGREVAELLAKGYAPFTGNPSSVHRPGRDARARLVAARDTVARLLGCEPKDVVLHLGRERRRGARHQGRVSRRATS